MERDDGAALLEGVDALAPRREPMAGRLDSAPPGGIHGLWSGSLVEKESVSTRPAGLCGAAHQTFERGKVCDSWGAR
jgi:hypothetical protein